MKSRRIVQYKRKHLTYAQQTCVSASGELMHRTNMIWPGCRMGIAVSGGVDSFVLLQTMLIRQKKLPFPVELMVFHLNPGFSEEDHPALYHWCSENGVAAHIEVTDYGPRAHSEENQSNSPCFWCSWLRRKRLFDLCAHYGCTHLAFGHTTEDLAATFFMNLFQTGKVEGLSPSRDFFQGQLKVVRPLLLVEKSTIKRAARQWRLPVWQNTCPSAKSTTRTEIWQGLESIMQKKKGRKKNLFQALSRWQLDLSS